MLNNKKITKEDFIILSVIGKGAYGKVMLVRKTNGIDEGKLYAMKQIKKSTIIQFNLIENTFTERNILVKMDHPNIVKMNYAF